MLSRLRRTSSKQPSESSSSSSTNTSRQASLAVAPSIPSRSGSTTTTTTPSQQQQSVSFLSLPAEIRNVIYSHVARHTRVLIRPTPPTPSKGKFNTAKVPPTQPAAPGLLLASKQTRAEFLPILLSTAPTSITITDFDFRNLVRITRSLYATELKALRLNPRLTIRCLATQPSKTSLVNLRRWLEQRCRCLDRLPWRYEVYWGRGPGVGVPTGSTTGQVVNAFVARKRVLGENLEALGVLREGLQEMVAAELGPFVEAFEAELRRMGAVVAGVGY